MKAILIYWIVGCLLAGGAIAHQRNICPLDPKIETKDILIMVAVWPMGLSLAWVSTDKSPLKCDVS